MALPSSPPLLPYSTSVDLPSSPPLLPVASSSWKHEVLMRKRHLEESESHHVSSDPLFSESSGPEDVTGYSRPKRKRMVKGPWWTLRTRGHEKHGSSEGDLSDKRDALRFADSGVWMGSDGTDASLESSWSRVRPARVAVRGPAIAVETPEHRAAAIIEQCVEDGKEMIDLTNMGITQLTLSTLLPLHHLIRQQHANSRSPPDEETFSELIPSIKLFLYGNQLTRVPDAILGLKNITALSVRNNNITELPAAIAKLPRLEELNITSNAIEYLPFELLDLLARKADRNTVSIRPNPLIEPMRIEGPCPLAEILTKAEKQKSEANADPHMWYREARRSAIAEGNWNLRVEIELRLTLARLLRSGSAVSEPRIPSTPNMSRSQEEIIYLGSSAVQKFEIDATQHDRGSDLATCLVDDASGPSQRSLSGSHTPSLFELSLRAAQKQYDLSIVPDHLPPRVQRALHKAAKASAVGHEECSTCGKAFIIPRARWFEYWYYGPPAKALSQEAILPFIRQVCSWGCISPTPIGTFR